MARTPAFERVLYVTAQATDRWFIPSEGPEISEDEPYDGLNLDKSMADQLDQCELLVSHRDDDDAANTQIGEAVQPGTLAAW